MPTINEIYLELDPTGSVAGNYIQYERHTLSNTNIRLITPKYGAFFSKDCNVYSVNIGTGQRTILTQTSQYHFVELAVQTTAELGEEIYYAILVTDTGVSNTVDITYRALGGDTNVHKDKLMELYTTLGASGGGNWNYVLEKPTAFTPTEGHWHDSDDVYGLEYIVDQLEAIRVSTLTADAAVHEQLLAKASSKDSEFLVTFNNDYIDKFDVLDGITQSATDILKATRVAALETAADLNELFTTTDRINEINRDYKTNNFNGKTSMLATLNLRKEHLTGHSLRDVISGMSGLELWLDTYNTASINVGFNSIDWVDQSTKARVFTALGAARPLLGVSANGFNQPVFKFNNNSVFNITSGPALVLGDEYTIFCVTGRIGTEMENLSVFSNTTDTLKVDYANASALRIGTHYNEANSVRVPSVNYAQPYDVVSKKTLTVLAVSKADQRQYAYTSFPENHVMHPDGVWFNETHVSDLSFSRIGNTVTYDSNAELCSILVFNRLLSKCETELVMEYFRIRESVEVNLIANGDFTQGFDGFSTDYPLSVLELATPYLKIEELAFGLEFPYPGKLSVHNAVADTVIHRLNVKVVPNVTYQYQFEIHNSTNQTITIEVKVNGLRHVKRITLAAGVSEYENIFSIRPNQSDLVVEIYCVSNAPGQRFAIDNLRLSRRIYCLNN